MGREMLTGMDSHEPDSIQGKASGGCRVQVKIMWYPPTFPHGGWTWKAHLGSNKAKKQRKNKRSNIPASFWDETAMLLKTRTKTEMTAFAIFIDLKGGWTELT